MKVTYLSAAVPLTKTFTLNNGVLEKQAHPKVTSCTSYEEEVSTIEEFKNSIEAHAAQGHCLLKGNTNRQLVSESRAGSTDANEKTSWVCLDLDKLQGIAEPNDLLVELKIDDVDHIIQYSSSMGVVPNSGQSAHIFMFTDQPGFPEFLKRWLTYMNLTVPMLSNNLNLTRTGNALRWGLDVTTCQNDKLIYIAPPLLGAGVESSIPPDGRIVLVKRKKRTIALPTDVLDTNNLKRLVQKGLNLIRSRDGLPTRTTSTIHHSGTIEWMANPDTTTVTGVKEDGPYIHLNLNGGDSWGYWHLKSNPEFIQNFKGEPAYKTSELVPEYWETVRPAGVSNDSSLVQHFVYCDERTASYHKAIWTPDTQNLRILPAKSKDQLRDFLKENNKPVMDFVPNWTVKFDPQSDTIVDMENKTINEFQASEYMKIKPSTGARVPPIIYKTIWSSFGSDQETYERLLNWMAVIWQFRCKAGTAWLTYGTTGTGKGTFANEILGKLYKYVEFKKARDIMSIYNEFLEKSLILVVDEAELGGKNGGSIINSDIKNFISEPSVSIRRMHQASYTVKSFVSTIFNSNVYVPVEIKYNDRRFNVAPFQKEPIKYLEGEWEAIAEELPEMAQFLGAYAADRQMARTPLMNEARKTLIWMGQTGTDSVVQYLKDGDYGFFVEGKPAMMNGTASDAEVKQATFYEKLVDTMKTRTYLLREEVQLLVSYLMDDIPRSSYKFESFMKHRGVVFEMITHEDKQYKGLKIKWKEPVSEDVVESEQVEPTKPKIRRQKVA